MKSSVIAVWLVVVASAMAEVRVVCPPNASPREQLAAKELVRYVYLRTGTAPAIGARARRAARPLNWSATPAG